MREEFFEGHSMDERYSYVLEIEKRNSYIARMRSAFS